MDYVFWSSLVNSGLLWVLLSYDIACQWAKNLHSRMPKLPSELHQPDTLNVKTCLPVWHAKAHQLECEVAHTISFVEGAGVTDGEEPERQWSIYNKASYATREMGEVSRANFLEDKMDYHSFMKNVQQGTLYFLSRSSSIPTHYPEFSLPKKLYIAHQEQLVQQANFSEIDATLDPTSRTKWLQHLHDWKEGTREDNPYMLDKSGKFSLLYRVSVLANRWCHARFPDGASSY